MNEYNERTVFSSIDDHGRYAYGNQPSIANWNLARFAETLLPFLHDDEAEAIRLAEKEIHAFSEVFMEEWELGMRKKLGIFNEEAEDKQLIKQLVTWMDERKVDLTNFFIHLTFDTFPQEEAFKTDEFLNWHLLWKNRLQRQAQSPEEVTALMREHNPALIPRNHLVERALTAAVEEGDLHPFTQLHQLLSNPYEHTAEQREMNEIAVPNQPYRTFCGT